LEVFTAGFVNPEDFPMIAHTIQASSAARNTDSIIRTFKIEE
jgi:hypothetical protein